jgi:hypothetical protein
MEMVIAYNVLNVHFYDLIGSYMVARELSSEVGVEARQAAAACSLCR